MTGTLAVMVSGRIAALRADVMARGGSFVKTLNPLARDVALGRAFRPGRSRVQARAALLEEVARLTRIEIRPGWRLAGEHLVPGHLPEFYFANPQNDFNKAVEHAQEFGMDACELGPVRAAVQEWLRPYQGQANCQAFGELDPDTLRGAVGGETGTQQVYIGLGWMENHSIRDFAKVLRLGFGGIRREVEDRLATARLDDPEYPQKENFWRAALHVCDAGILLGRRYAELAARQADGAEDPEERLRLSQMAEACARVPAEGARTFFEAVQSLWLAQILTGGEDGINANSLGRLDQILYPYYEADRAAGRLTRVDALEILEEFTCKLYLDYEVQATILGGVDRDGRDAVNDLSYLILEATRNVGFVRDLSVRLHRESPPAFVRLAAEMIARGGGIPFIFNDDCFIKALADRGIAMEDARDYAPIGCIELTVPGRANPHAVSGWFNAPKCLELALFDGVDPRSGARVGPPTGGLADFASFEEFEAAYWRQVEFFAPRMAYHIARGELAQREFGPMPCWSVLTDDCIARGRDITDGGAVYNYHSICFLGTANTADSLMALKRLYFEERRFTAEELLDALRDNFAGHEPLRQMLLRQAPKYGNDEPEVDALARRVTDRFIDLMDTMRSPLGGRYHVHLFSFLTHIAFGKVVGATPDGRYANEPLAYSLSAQQGRDERGVTALLGSLARLPHDRAAGATAAIIELDSVMVEGEAGVERFAQLIQAAITMEIGQMQWNVTTVERLRQAQADPERYGNLPVRVAGYSQMFKLVDRELQEHIIARTKHRR